MATKRNIEKRRKLSELYAKGQEVRFSQDGVVNSPVDERDGRHLTKDEWLQREGNPDADTSQYLWPSNDDVIVWVTPPSPLQREEVVRAAQSARARIVLLAKKENDDSYESLLSSSFVEEMETENLIDYVLEGEMQEFRPRAMREVLGRKEWEDFSALQDSMREWEELGQPEGPEWDALIERDEEYGKQIQSRMKEMLDDTRDALKLLPDAELRKRAKKRHQDAVGNQSFMEAYERNMLFFACRDDENKKELFFESIQELMSQEEFVQVALANTLAKHISDPKQAKNSPRVAPGSQQSVLPAEQETSEASTPKEQSD